MHYYVTSPTGERLAGFDTYYEAEHYSRSYALSGLLTIIKGKPFEA